MQNEAQEFHFTYLLHEMEIYEELGACILGTPHLQPGGRTLRFFVRWFPREFSTPLGQILDDAPTPGHANLKNKRTFNIPPANEFEQGARKVRKSHEEKELEVAISRRYSRTRVYAGKNRVSAYVNGLSDLPILDKDTLDILEYLNVYLTEPIEIPLNIE